MNSSPALYFRETKFDFVRRFIIPLLTLAMATVKLASPAFSLRVIAHATFVMVLIFAIFTILFRSFRRQYASLSADYSVKTRILDVISLSILVLAFSGFAKVIEL